MTMMKTAQGAMIFALTATFGASAIACPDCDHKAASTASPSVAAAPAADALTVVRDRETGQLRAPTAAEVANMQRRAEAVVGANAGAAAVAAEPLLRTHASGARSARLTADMASYSVAVRRTDGSLDMSCVQGQDAAAKAMSSAPVAKRSATAETE